MKWSFTNGYKSFIQHENSFSWKWSGLKFLILSECFFWSPKLQISHHSEIRQHRFLDRRPKISPHFSQRLSTGNLRPGSRVVWILLLVCVFFFFFLATNLHVTTRMIQFIEAQREFHCKNTERLEDPCLICWSFSRRQVLQICCHLFLYFARQQDSQDHKRIHLVRTTGRLDQSAFCEDSRISHVFQLPRKLIQR